MRGSWVYNYYCDESCHLENDDSNVMVLGALILPKDKKKEISDNIVDIKKRHGVKARTEVKWTKLSNAKLDLYRELVDYFFYDDDLRFRVLVADKTRLRHESFHQSHNDWYYKMYFTMLKALFKRDSHYYVYIDIKDTHSGENAAKLQSVCANDAYDFNHDIVRRVQPIRSEEVQLMQLVDILTGALAYRHNHANVTKETSRSKIAIINRVIQRSGISLTKTTLASEKKLNLLVWRPNEVVRL